MTVAASPALSGPLALIGLASLLGCAAPVPPEDLAWAPGAQVARTQVGDLSLRSVRLGSGPDLVLLHTLRTQLDMFQKVAGPLSNDFTVHLVDYPGHGWSDIPDATYDADFFVRTVGDWLTAAGVRDATVAGESIGGSIALLLAAEGHPAVARAIAVNPYDYAGGRGLARSSGVARLVSGAASIPGLGSIVVRLENRAILRNILEGGATNDGAFPAALIDAISESGARPGQSAAFLSLLRNSASWEAARARYGEIAAPTLVIYGAQDWSLPEERRATIEAIPGAAAIEIDPGGHFLSVDAPNRLVEAIGGFAASD